MKNPVSQALVSILNERANQGIKYSDTHDEAHSRQEWAELVDGYMVASVNCETLEHFRMALVAAGALILAELETSYRIGLPTRLLS